MFSGKAFWIDQFGTAAEKFSEKAVKGRVIGREQVVVHEEGNFINISQFFKFRGVFRNSTKTLFPNFVISCTLRNQLPL